MDEQLTAGRSEKGVRCEDEVCRAWGG